MGHTQNLQHHVAFEALVVKIWDIGSLQQGKDAIDYKNQISVCQNSLFNFFQFIPFNVTNSNKNKWLAYRCSSGWMWLVLVTSLKPVISYLRCSDSSLCMKSFLLTVLAIALESFYKAENDNNEDLSQRSWQYFDCYH